MRPTDWRTCPIEQQRSLARIRHKQSSAHASSPWNISIAGIRRREDSLRSSSSQNVSRCGAGTATFGSRAGRGGSDIMSVRSSGRCITPRRNVRTRWSHEQHARCALAVVARFDFPSTTRGYRRSISFTYNADAWAGLSPLRLVGSLHHNKVSQNG